MPDKPRTSLPFESDDPAEQKLWSALADLPRDEPSDHLRRGFYARLHDATSRSWVDSLGRRLGFGSGSGWATAAACLLIGFGIAQITDRSAPDSSRLSTLEQSVAQLQRDLVLDRLNDVSASARLKGVVEATQVVARDTRVAKALLERAARDDSVTVRSAAIEALASQLQLADVSIGLMDLLEEAESPIVQLALVDLFLRHGDSEHIRRLENLADSNQLHPDLIRHINNSLGSQSI